MSKAGLKYLPNLDSLRALAALIVVISHIELQKQELGLANIRSVVKDFGAIGVTSFFVLSGFLITYLLFQEHTSKGKIDILKFYFRRILRIWPLYFVVLLFGIFIYPGNVDSTGILLSVFFLPNIAFMLHKLPGLIDPIWSLGVEEQFYMFHPHFFRFRNLVLVFNILIGMFIFFYALKAAASKFHWEFIQNMMYKARFDCMMIGGIFGMWVKNNQTNNQHFKPWIRPDFMFDQTFQRLLFLVYAAYLFTVILVKPNIYSDQLLSIFTALIIANLALNPACIISIENKQLAFIGKISFGLYLLHKFPVHLMIVTTQNLGIKSLFLQNLFIYTTSVALSILIAYLSFHYYESYFLRLKDRKYTV